MMLPSFLETWRNTGISQHCRLSEMVDTSCSSYPAKLSFLILDKKEAFFSSRKKGCEHLSWAVCIDMLRSELQARLGEFGPQALNFWVSLSSVILFPTMDCQSAFSDLCITSKKSAIWEVTPLFGFLSPLSSLLQCTPAPWWDSSRQVVSVHITADHASDFFPNPPQDDSLSDFGVAHIGLWAIPKSLPFKKNVFSQPFNCIGTKHTRTANN